MRLCAIGLGIGLTLAVALATALASTLVMMDTFDVAAFSAGIVIIIAACLVAAFYPARRAAGVEPMVALRVESPRRLRCARTSTSVIRNVYSERNATIGSIFVARRAGTYDARPATAASVNATAVIVAGSRGLTL